MRSSTVLSACVALTLACTSQDGSTEPEAGSNPSPAVSPVLATASNTWTQRAPHNFGTVFGVSAGVATDVAGQSVVYAFGGFDFVESSLGEVGNTPVRIYRVATNTWTVDTPHISLYKLNGVGTIGGKLYVSGGYNGIDGGDELESRQVWAYDPTTHRLLNRANMPRFTAEGVTGVIRDKLYVMPGSCDANFWPQPGYCKQESVRALYRYDPATNKWKARRSAPHFHKSGAAGVIGGKLYVVGGLNGFQSVADLDVYDPATDSWKTLAPIPSAGPAIGTALQAKLYVLSGSKAYVYDPSTNKWSPIAAPTWTHEAIVRVVLDDKARLLAVGGHHGVRGDIPNNSELYTP